MNDAANISLTRLREYERGHRRSYFVLFEIALFVIIIGLLLITLGSGVNVYRNISDQRWEDEQSRTGLSLIANSVHITDTIDAVGVSSGPEGQALVLTERFAAGSYETRIYLYQGNVVEEYAVAGTPYTPARATQLIESNSFSFSYANGLLTVNTDHGSEQIMFHSVRKTDAQVANVVQAATQPVETDEGEPDVGAQAPEEAPATLEEAEEAPATEEGVSQAAAPDEELGGGEDAA